MFRKLCGENALKNVILATTQWENVSEATGVERERELRNTEDFWKELLDRGATLARYQGDHDSGMALVEQLAIKSRVTLNMQHELINEGKALVDTEAGQAINEELHKLRDQY